MSDWSLAIMQNQERVLHRLRQQQLSWRAAEGKTLKFSRAAAAIQESGVAADSPAVACFVPGRIEVLGKHTDYAGGRSLIAAAECGICMVAVAEAQPRVVVTDVAVEESVEFPLSPDIQPRQGHWANYPMTVARRVARNFNEPLCGARIAFSSDLPLAAGMSSSSALMIAIFQMLASVNDLSSRDNYRQNIRCNEDLAGYLATIENGQNYGALRGDHGVGTFGGSEDHTAILCAAAGELSQYSYCPIQYERSIALPPELSFVVAVSGIVAEKTKAAMTKYNRISRLAAAVVDTWRQATGREDPHLAAVLRSTTDATQQLRSILRQASHPEFSNAELLDRFEQFRVESEEIIPGVPVPLIGDALQQFGQLVDRSQQLGAQYLQNQVPETVFLAGRARQLGAVAASAFGAGFGGSVWALIEHGELDTFGQAWLAEYRAAFPEHSSRAAFIVSGAGPAAFTFGSAVQPA